MIPKPEHLITLRLQPARAPFVSGKPLWLTMLATIDFDDELRRVVAKVCDIRTDGGLLPKLKTPAV
jgi:hypothetical protein